MVTVMAGGLSFPWDWVLPAGEDALHGGPVQATSSVLACPVTPILQLQEQGASLPKPRPPPPILWQAAPRALSPYMAETTHIST